MCIHRVLILVVAEILTVGPVGLCQSQPPESFDAVAINRWNMERGKSGVTLSSDRLDALAVTLRDLIAEAYGVEDQWIAGTSSWMDTERYNIRATAGKPATPSELRAMLQNTLADRFRLTIHHEPRMVKAYALVVDRGGPKLTPRDEEVPRRVAPPGQDIFEFAYTIHDLVHRINSGSMPPQSIGRPVVDRTGLTGEYHLALRAETEPLPDGRGHKIDIDYFSAFRELGLRLDPIEESFDRIVVDGATRPTPN